MSSSSSTLFRMFKKAKQSSEPSKIVVEGLGSVDCFASLYMRNNVELKEDIVIHFVTNF